MLALLNAMPVAQLGGPSEGEFYGVPVHEVQGKMFRILVVLVATSLWDFGLAVVDSLACSLCVGLCQAC
jgi:hypothetical protein